MSRHPEAHLCCASPLRHRAPGARSRTHRGCESSEGLRVMDPSRLYSADLNPTSSTRTATITVGTATFTVTQAAGSNSLCNFGLTSSTVSAVPASQSGTLQLTAASASCSWTASSNASWAEVYPLSGAGAASINYTIYPNFTTVERTAIITVAGITVTITQAGAAGSANERFVKLLYFNLLG